MLLNNKDSGRRQMPAQWLLCPSRHVPQAEDSTGRLLPKVTRGIASPPLSRVCQQSQTGWQSPPLTRR